MRGVGGDHHAPGGLPVDNPDVLTQTWFVALLGSMVTVMILLFAAILLVWRRQQQRKSSMLSNIYGELKLTSPSNASAPRKPYFTRKSRRRFKVRMVLSGKG